MKRYLSLIIFNMLVWAGCSALDDSEYVELVELFPENEEYFVDQAGGTVGVTIYSNGEVNVRALNDFSPFCTLDTYSFRGDAVLNLNFTRNNGFRRMAMLELSLKDEDRKDTVFVRQYGKTPYLECSAPYKTVYGNHDGDVRFEIKSNVPMDKVQQSVLYVSGAEDWIRSMYPMLDVFVVETKASMSERTSKAKIELSYIDGWNETVSLDLYVTGSNKDGFFGDRISFEKAREYAGTGPVEEDVFIEGVVISDHNSANMCLNPSVNYDMIDITENKKTAYIQSLDGTLGFKLKFDSESENILTRGTYLSLSLEGLTVVKEVDPVRYSIVNLSGENMVGSESGATVVGKEKTISQLTDEDIYTCVSLVRTEFVYKSGTYANVYENYTLASSVNEMNSGCNNRLDGWASLLIDDEGNGIYAPVNMLCLWRRSGAGVPQGVGITEGIIVHEEMPRYGNIGRYQIRVLDETGFKQSYDGESSYKEFAEYDGAPYQYRYAQWSDINARYADPGDPNTRLEKSIIPSDDISADNPVPKVEMFIENTSPGSGNYPISGGGAYSYLTADSRGVYPSSTPVGQYRRSLSLNTEIKGWYKWTENKITGYNGIRMEMSTASLSGTTMYVHYSFDVGSISASTSQFFPAHWCVEYSLDGGASYTVCPDNVTGLSYVHLRTLPWWDVTIAGIKYYTSAACGLGPTDHVAVLPAEVFGREKLIIRIRPYDNVMAVFPIMWDGDSENGTVEYNTTVKATKINFECINIRYK